MEGGSSSRMTHSVGGNDMTVEVIWDRNSPERPRTLLGAGRLGGRKDGQCIKVGIHVSSLIRRFGFWVEELFDLGKVCRIHSSCGDNAVYPIVILLSGRGAEGKSVVQILQIEAWDFQLLRTYSGSIDTQRPFVCPFVIDIWLTSALR